MIRTRPFPPVITFSPIRDMNMRAISRYIAAASVLGVCTASCESLDTRSAATEAPRYPPIIEHRTKLPFRFECNKELVQDLKKENVEDQYILGTNTRCMLGKLDCIFGALSVVTLCRIYVGWCKLAIARAYAYGLTLSPSALYKAKELYLRNDSERELLDVLLEAKEKESELLLNGQTVEGSRSGDLGILIVMARDIDGDHLAHGFRHSLLARMKAKAAHTSSSDKDLYSSNRTNAFESGKRASNLESEYQPDLAENGHSTAKSSAQPLQHLTKFLSAYKNLHLRVGQEIYFVWNADGELNTFIDGKLVPEATIRYAPLAGALFEVYAGRDAVSARARTTFINNLISAVEKNVVDKKYVPLVKNEREKASGASIVPTMSPLASVLKEALVLNTSQLYGIVKLEHESRTK